MSQPEAITDDFPERCLLDVRLLPGDPPRAIRMRAWLKRGLRDFGIKLERLVPAGDGDELPRSDPSTG